MRKVVSGVLISNEWRLFDFRSADFTVVQVARSIIPWGDSYSLFRKKSLDPFSTKYLLRQSCKEAGRWKETLSW